MRALYLSLLLALLSAPLLAQNVQFRGGTIAIGDSLEKLLKVAGKPDQVRPFPGSPTSTLYEYSAGNRHISISVKDGKVRGIADNNIVSVPTPVRPAGVQLNGNRIVTGDTVERLLLVAGKPSRIRTFPGMAIYEYSSTGREVTVTVRGGKVSGTSEMNVVKKVRAPGSSPKA